jgi:zinc transport system permease protein
VLIALFSGIVGLTVTFYLDASAGAAIVLVSAAVYAVSLGIRTARK